MRKVVSYRMPWVDICPTWKVSYTHYTIQYRTPPILYNWASFLVPTSYLFIYLYIYFLPPSIRTYMSITYTYALHKRLLFDDNRWHCSWHYCDECAKSSVTGCVECLDSYCRAHIPEDKLPLIKEAWARNQLSLAGIDAPASSKAAMALYNRAVYAHTGRQLRNNKAADEVPYVEEFDVSKLKWGSAQFLCPECKLDSEVRKKKLATIDHSNCKNSRKRR